MWCIEYSPVIVSIMIIIIRGGSRTSIDRHL